MSRVGAPTDKGAMEAIKGWAKTEMFIDFNLGKSDNVQETIEKICTIL